MSGRVLTCSVTEAGAALARRLPFEHHHGRLVATVAARWGDVDGLVLIAATGIAVRAVGPLLADKATDPAVVCVDDAGRWAVALAGGHAGGANALAREVAALLGAEPVVTTATDGAGLPGLDTLPGLSAEGDVAGVTRAWLDGQPPVVEVDPALAGWPLPEFLTRLRPAPGGPGHRARPATRVLVTDRHVPPEPGVVVLHPPSLVAGVGSSTAAPPEEAAALLDAALVEAGLSRRSLGEVATLDRKAAEPAVAALGPPVRAYPAERLAAQPVPHPSDVVARAVGTPSVSEAAALVAAGAGAELVTPKRASASVTVALARRRRPRGHVAVVGLGPGDPALRTPAASAAVRHAGVVIGYGPYVDLAADLLGPHQEVIRSPIGAEAERCRTALARGAGGEHVALVCSGDPGVYAMASLVCELAPGLGDPPVTVVPGVTAALAAAAVLGAPLGHDHAAVSLSDLLTPWAVIERRLRAVAEADLVVSLYNPRSQRRSTQLQRAVAILAGHRSTDTPAAVVTDAGRPGQRVVRTTLAALDPGGVDMLSLVVVGATTTRWVGGRMVTPRGYQT